MSPRSLDASTALNFISWRYKCIGLMLLPLLTSISRADVDSGGGISNSGSINNHSSIGSPIETSTLSGGTYTLKSGLVGVLFTTSGNIPPDTNGNGLPDEWEQNYFPGQTVDPQADSDGDGTSNLMEYLSGTVPTDPASRFRPVGTLNASTYVLPIQTTAGRTYKVWVTKDLKSWQLQQTYTGDGTQKIFSFDESAIASGPLYSPTHPSKYFFRVEIVLL